MAGDPRLNFAVTRVVTAPSPATSGLTLSVTAGTGALFPPAPFGEVVVCPAGSAPTLANAEVIRVMSKGAGDNWTIKRTQEGSSARAIQIGDQLFFGVTGKTMNDASPTDVVEGAQLLVWGNSYPTTIAGTRNYFDRIRSRIQSSVFASYAVAARLCEDTCQYMFGTFTELRQGAALDGTSKSVGAATVTAAYAFRQDGVAIAEVLRNSSGYARSTANGGSFSKAQTSCRNALHAMIALLRSGSNYTFGGLFENTLLPGTLTMTSGSPVVPWTGAAQRHVGRLITGTLGIPANTYVGAVVAGVSLRMSSSPTSQIDVNATANGASVVVLGPKRAGTWTSEASTISTGGFRNYTTTNGDTTTYTINSKGGRCWMVTQSVDSTYTTRTGSTYSVTVDGGAAITGTTNDQTRRTIGGFTSSTGYCQQAIDLGVLAAGFHTVVMTHTGSAGHYLFDDCAMVESDAPPTVLIPKLGDVGTLGYADYTGAGVSASYADDQTFNALLDTEIATWPADQSVITWDPQAAGFDYTVHVGNADGAHIHLSSLGEAFYANGLLGVLNGLPVRAGLTKQ